MQVRRGSTSKTICTFSSCGEWIFSMDVQPALSLSLGLSTRIGQAEGSCASVCCHRGHTPAQPKPNWAGPCTGKKTPHRWEAGHSLPAGHLAASFGPHLGPSVCFHTSLAPPGLALRLWSTVSLAAESSVGPTRVLSRPHKWRYGNRSEGGGSRGAVSKEVGRSILEKTWGWILQAF